jgi:phosphotriesterase-related protein
MGFTLMHEHVSLRWAPLYVSYPERWNRESIMAVAIDRLKAAKAAGVRTMVDLTPIDLGRDPLFIAEAARKSGMQVVVPTGFYFYGHGYPAATPKEQILELLIRDITVGIGETGIRAGVIKAATEPAVDWSNERLLRVAARAHRATGVPLCTHTFPENRTGLDQQRIFKEEGCDLSRIVIGHSDDSGDIEYLDEIIQNGSYCGMDRIGIDFKRDTVQRADMVAALVHRGYAERITLSHDASCHSDGWVQESMLERMPNWRFEFIPGRFSDMLRERGVTDAQIHQMTVANPRRIFEMNQPY